MQRRSGLSPPVGLRGMWHWKRCKEGARIAGFARPPAPSKIEVWLSSKNNNREHLPPILNQIADVVGYDAAISIVRAFGGTQLYIPKKPNNKLEAVIGTALAKRLCEHLSCTSFDVPHGPYAQHANYRSQIYAQHLLGLSPEKTAHLLKISLRTVYRWKAVFRAEEDFRQQQLTRGRTAAITKRK